MMAIPNPKTSGTNSRLGNYSEDDRGTTHVANELNQEKSRGQISQKPQLKTDHQRVKSYQHFVGNPLRKDLVGSLVIKAITAGQDNKTSKLNINPNTIIYSAASLSVSDSFNEDGRQVTYSSLYYFSYFMHWIYYPKCSKDDKNITS